jgi:hypothetical protein
VSTLEKVSETKDRGAGEGSTSPKGDELYILYFRWGAFRVSLTSKPALIDVGNTHPRGSGFAGIVAAFALEPQCLNVFD